MSALRRKSHEPIDWEAVRDTLRRTQGATHEELSSERSHAILDARARALAQPMERAAAGDHLELMTFALGAERYAIETKYLREVVRFVDFTPVPGTPSFVVGVTNYRGQILCVVDLRSFFRAPSPALTDLSRVIVVGVETAEFGILADRTEAIASLAPGELQSPPGSVSEIGQECMLGITRDALLVLNGAKVLQDSRLFVNQREAIHSAPES